MSTSYNTSQSALPPASPVHIRRQDHISDKPSGTTASLDDDDDDDDDEQDDDFYDTFSSASPLHHLHSASLPTSLELGEPPIHDALRHPTPRDAYSTSRPSAPQAEVEREDHRGPTEDESEEVEEEFDEVEEVLGSYEGYHSADDRSGEIELELEQEGDEVGSLSSESQRPRSRSQDAADGTDALLEQIRSTGPAFSDPNPIGVPILPLLPSSDDDIDVDDDDEPELAEDLSASTMSASATLLPPTSSLAQLPFFRSHSFGLPSPSPSTSAASAAQPPPWRRPVPIAAPEPATAATEPAEEGALPTVYILFIAFVSGSNSASDRERERGRAPAPGAGAGAGGAGAGGARRQEPIAVPSERQIVDLPGITPPARDDEGEEERVRAREALESLRDDTRRALRELTEEGVVDLGDVDAEADAGMEVRETRGEAMVVDQGEEEMAEMVEEEMEVEVEEWEEEVLEQTTEEEEEEDGPPPPLEPIPMPAVSGQEEQTTELEAPPASQANGALADAYAGVGVNEAEAEAGAGADAEAADETLRISLPSNSPTSEPTSTSTEPIPTPAPIPAADTTTSPPPVPSAHATSAPAAPGSAARRAPTSISATRAQMRNTPPGGRYFIYVGHYPNGERPGPIEPPRPPPARAPGTGWSTLPRRLLNMVPGFGGAGNREDEGEETQAREEAADEPEAAEAEAQPQTEVEDAPPAQAGPTNPLGGATVGQQIEVTYETWRRVADIIAPDESDNNGGMLTGAGVGALAAILAAMGVSLAGSREKVTVSEEEIGNSGLRVVKGAQVRECTARGEVQGGTGEECTICLMPYEDEDEVRLMQCKHAFHRACVDQWLSTGRNACPACRQTGVRKVDDEDTKVAADDDDAAEPADDPAPSPTSADGIPPPQIADSQTSGERADLDEAVLSDSDLAALQAIANYDGDDVVL